MSIAEKLTAIAENVQKVYESGLAAGSGGNAGETESIIDRSILEIKSDAKTVGSYAFTYCAALTTAVFPLATSIGYSAFNGCTALTTADFASVTRIVNYAFYGCARLTALILRNETAVCTLADASSLTNCNPYIYVPSALVDSYKTAAKWNDYAERFRVLEDYTVDGTMIGELDPDKI